MTTFAQAAYDDSRHTLTENGANAYNSTGHAVLDLFGCIGGLRQRHARDIERLFAEAYKENALLATRCLFYARDVRGGLGERNTFRVLLHYAAIKHPEAVLPNIPYIGIYGRFDDLYALIGTQLEESMWKHMDQQFRLDEYHMRRNEPVSLLAKWIKTPDASSKQTRTLGIMTANKLDKTVYHFKRRLRSLRRYIGIVEAKMSANEWTEIDYAAVPSRAMMIYRNAFKKHDEARFAAFLGKVDKGEATIHAATLFPYDLVEKYESMGRQAVEDRTLEAQWRALPDYVGTECNAIVMADTSSSMTGRPMMSSLALAVYFAERNQGAYHGLWMSFSQQPMMHRLAGETLLQKLQSIERKYWSNNTNIELAFRKILDIAIHRNVAPEDMVKSLIIVSDMEFDQTQYGHDWSFYDNMAALYASHGYTIPNIVFWNVNSRNDVFHADANRRGVQLVSGQSASTFKQLMQSVGMNPVEMMENVLNSERYQPIAVG